MKLVLESYRKDVLINTNPRKVFERILFGGARRALIVKRATRYRLNKSIKAMPIPWSKDCGIGIFYLSLRQLKVQRADKKAVSPKMYGIKERESKLQLMKKLLFF